MTIPLSAFIITRNEEARLGQTIAALQPWAGEVVVIDSGSTDGTVALARQMGARVLTRAWDGYGPQKKFAEAQCQNDWVLNVDADEVVTPALAKEIVELFQDGPPEPTAFAIRVLNVYPGQNKPRPFASDYKLVRLYHRSIASYRPHPYFDRVEVFGASLRDLRHPIWHYPYRSLAHFVEKANALTSFIATLESDSKRSVAHLRLRLITEFPMSFLKAYILRRHATGGWKGLQFAMLYASLRYLRIAKLLEAREQLEQAGHGCPALPDAPMSRRQPR